MKRIIIVLSVLLVVCVVAAAVVPSFFDWNSYKPQIQEQAKTQLGLDLSINGNIELSVLPAPHVIVSDVKLARSGLDAKAGQILSFERFELYVDLIPLIYGKVVLSSATLIKPFFNVQEVAEGQYNFSSPEIESLTKDNKAQTGEASGSAFSVQIGRVKIKEGSLTFENIGGNKTELENINLELGASDMTGPFEVQGDADYAGKKIKLDVSAAEIAQGTKQTSLKANIQIMPENVELSYSGAVTWANGFELQGETKLVVEDISSVVQVKDSGLNIKSISASSMVTANQNQVELKDLQVISGRNKLSGALKFQNAPFTVNGNLKTNQKIALADIHSGLGNLSDAQLDINFSSDGKKISLSKSAVSIADIPVNIDAFLQVAEDASKRSKLSIAVDAPDLDLTKFSAAKSSGGKPAQDNTVAVNKTLGTLALPFDLDLAFKAKSLKYEAYALRNAAGIVKIGKDSIALEKFSVDDFAGASIAGDASIEGLGKTDNVKADIRVDTKNTKVFLQNLNVDTASLPEQITSSSMAVRYKGNKEQGDLKLDISALKGVVGISGNVKNILAKPELSDLDFTLEHPDMRQVVSLASGSEFTDRNFSKAISFRSKIRQNGKQYLIEDIQGDLSGASLRGKMQINLEGQKPFAAGDLQFGKLAFDVSGAPKGGSNKKSSGSSPSSGSAGKKWSTEEFDTSFLNKINFDFKISANHIDYGDWPLVSPKIHAVLQNGALDISELQAGIFDGQVGLTAKVNSVDQPRQPLHIQGNASFKNVSLERLSSTLTGNNFVKVSGKVDGNTDLKTSGLSPAALIYDLSGQGVLSGQNLVLEGVDVVRFARALSDESRPGDTVLGIWKGSTSGGSTQFDTLEGQYVISEGIVNIQKMELDGQKAQIQTTGNIDLPNWLLSTKHKIIVKPENADVPSDVPPFEVSFSGSLDNPTQTFGQGLLNDYLQRKLQRKLNSIISDKLGLPQANDNAPPPSGEPQGQQAPEQQQEEQPMDAEDAAKEAIKDALKGFLQ